MVDKWHRDGSKLDGIATGATNVTNNNQLTNGAGYNTASSNINASNLSSGTIPDARWWNRDFTSYQWFKLNRTCCISIWN